MSEEKDPKNREELQQITKDFPLMMTLTQVVIGVRLLQEISKKLYSEH